LGTAYSLAGWLLALLLLADSLQRWKAQTLKRGRFGLRQSWIHQALRKLPKTPPRGDITGSYSNCSPQPHTTTLLVAGLTWIIKKSKDQETVKFYRIDG
jgi:hypothetical protein